LFSLCIFPFASTLKQSALTMSPHHHSLGHTNTDSYTENGGRILGRATRLRLAELADAFEFEDCVSECLESLGRGLTLEAAITALDDIPEQLRQHDAIDDLEELVQTALIKEIDKLARIYNMEGRALAQGWRRVGQDAGARR